jgi:hypothetical protein
MTGGTGGDSLLQQRAASNAQAATLLQPTAILL